MLAAGKASRGTFLRHGLSPMCTVLTFLVFLFHLSAVESIADTHLASLRQDAAYLFHHGFDGYMKYAFPEDELRPITCDAFTRDFDDQNHWELNDPLGDYSLTLIDSLSTLAILASSSQSKQERRKAFKQFQESVQTVVELYGDGSEGPAGFGERARGFDIDSKVQVFETAIRGLGGLLSAHLFSVGELPILDYNPKELARKGDSGSARIKWSKTFHYDGQLLRLAHDLGKRLLPAFSTQTGIPYPRVNLRHGIPFYRNAPQNHDAEPPDDVYGQSGQCPAMPRSDDERTETCSAGAGSLVLEFSTLSRLTDDDRFEKLAKKAFWAVWERRMPTGLVGSGIDAETGEWKGAPSTGIGAGIDSFYEYAIKSYVLLSGTEPFAEKPANASTVHNFEPSPLTPLQEDAESFLVAWEHSQQAIRRHVYLSENAVHPHYTQVNLYNAAQQATWIDSLSAFYSGSLVLAGHVEEAAVTHLLFTALWARYSALPERWSTTTGDIEHGLPWWPGRPEFIESAYYLYRATEDPWYIHVGEMTLRDIKRQCWTPCGWAGIQDVRTGELTDRMESFFLGETAKYLHLLFDPDHPLNKLDAPWVFSTEGHPLIIPKSKLKQVNKKPERKVQSRSTSGPTCPAAPTPLPLTVSNTAARPDLFHAAALARLHLNSREAEFQPALFQEENEWQGSAIDEFRSPTNFSFYPWTLPMNLIPPTGTCAPIPEVPTFHISFPTPTSLVIHGPNHRTMKGIFMNNLAGIRLSMIQNLAGKMDATGSFRVNAINSQPIGRDEQLFVSSDTISSVVTDNDPNFARIRDSVNLQVVFDMPKPATATPAVRRSPSLNSSQVSSESLLDRLAEIGPDQHGALLEELAKQANSAEGAIASALRFIAEKLSPKVSSVPSPDPEPEASFYRSYVNGIIAAGAGSAPLPNIQDAKSPDTNTGQPNGQLLWTNIHAADNLCEQLLSQDTVQKNEVLVIKRGGCSFSEKLEKIPSFVSSKHSLQVVILVNDHSADEAPGSQAGHSDPGLRPQENSAYISFRPVLDKPQRTPGGLLRRNPIPMVMVEGGDGMYNALSKATALGIKRRYHIQAQGLPISNVHIL